MLKYIIAVILVILAWVAWFLFDEPGDYWWAPLGFTVLVIAVLATIVVARRLRARRAARELEKALAAQAAEQARSARPDMQAEILQMQQEFQRAIAALKGSRLARGGENALYALPWYLMIGPPGAGKTTALRNSGLQFPYMSQSGGGVRGVGGTRNCDWWLTNEGVLLDTAGRWTTEDEDRDEWNSFLDLLRKYRPEKPLNGIVVAISLGDLGGAHEEEVGALARRTRERIDEVQSRLQLSLPVYVMFTKADLIPGFVETFNDLSKNDRGQIWGFTVPLAGPPVDPGLHFNERFDEMQGSIEKRSTARMSAERKIETRELIHSFPQQLATLKRNCHDLVGQIFEASVYGATPRMRGVYFTSGTQEGRPIDRVMHKMAEAFGIRSEINLGEPVTEAKSYFLRDVFLKVVFPDHEIASRSEAELRRQRRNRYLAAAAIFGTALLVATLPTYAWSRNVSFLDETQGIVDEVQTASEAEGPLTPAQLGSLRERVNRLREYDQVGAPVYMRLGMYQDDVYHPVRDYYTRILQGEVVQPLWLADQTELDRFGRHYEALPDSIPTGAEHAANYDRLRLHLLLTRPVEEGQPNLLEDDSEEIRNWVGDEIVERWVDQVTDGNPEELEDGVREQMLEHARLFASLLAEGDETDGEYVPNANDMRFARDVDGVRRVRGALTRVSVTDMALVRIIQSVPEEYNLTLESLIGNTVRPMRCQRRLPDPVTNEFRNFPCTVRGAFTRRAWDERVREMLESPEGGAFGEPWVLGRELQQSQARQEEAQQNMRRLRNEFYTAYVVEWRDFVRDIRVDMARHPEPLVESQEILADQQHLTRGSPQPYRLLFSQILYNTMLPVPQEGGSATAEAVQQAWWQRALNRISRIRGGQTVRRLIDAASSGQGSLDPNSMEEELTPEHVFLTFEGLTKFGALPPPPPPAEGQQPPPPPELPVGAYEQQLATVRDALQANLDNPQGTDEALITALQTARTSTRALIESQEVGWRPRFQALLWPPIDGTAQSHATRQAGGAGRSWCTEVYTPYSRNILGGYPLNPSGHDIPLADFGAFYMRETGTLWAFYGEVLRRRIPREGEQFMFATNLGQGAGNAYRRELLQYLERAQDITNTFFPPGAEGPTVQFDVRIRPSVRVATQNLCISGTCVEHHNGPEQWHRFTWPGEDAVAGASIEVRGEGGIHEMIQQPGEWGLFRLLEQGTVTSASNGRRVFTVNWRLRDHEIDVSVDIRPVRGDAPFFGVAGRERNPPLLQPLRAQDVDPPREIANGRTTCQVR